MAALLKSPHMELASECIIEFLGTGLLAFTVACSAGQGASLAGFAIGSTLMCAIYAGGHLSGANYNPAVSLALFLTGNMDAQKMGIYMATQVVGGICASLTYPESVTEGVDAGTSWYLEVDS